MIEPAESSFNDMIEPAESSFNDMIEPQRVVLMI